MVDATISRARMRDLARLGASHGRAVTDAGGIADVPSLRRRAASSRPETDDLMASTI
jgi:hypothetical protein